MIVRTQVLLLVITFMGMVFAQTPLSVLVHDQSWRQGQDVEVLNMQVQLGRIERFLEFLTHLMSGNTQDVADWVMSSGRGDSWVLCVRDQFVTKQDLIKTDIRDHLKRFPFSQISEKMHSQTCKQMLVKIQETSDISELNTYLKVLVNKESAEKSVLIELKDLACITYLFYVYFSGLCAKQCASSKRSSFWDNFMPHQENALMNLLYTYNAIDKLPVESVISSIDTFIKEFTHMLTKLQSDDNGNNEESVNADGGFAGWLKEKWVLLPLAVGVIIIKTVYYFWVKEKEKDGIYIPFPFMHGINTNLK